jgi:UDP-N-acetyl-D-mannosaminuronic acid dehydrogenase
VGVGGHCIAVDPWFLITQYPEETKPMRTARKTNLHKTEWVINKIKKEAKKFERAYGRKPKIAALGLTYKPDIDDLRESPALYIVKKLKEESFEIFPVEPNIGESSEFEIYKLNDALELADIVVVLVAHRDFEIDFSSYNVLDFCGVLK